MAFLKTLCALFAALCLNHVCIAAELEQTTSTDVTLDDLIKCIKSQRESIQDCITKYSVTDEVLQHYFDVHNKQRNDMLKFNADAKKDVIDPKQIPPALDEKSIQTHIVKQFELTTSGPFY